MALYPYLRMLDSVILEILSGLPIPVTANKKYETQANNKKALIWAILSYKYVQIFQNHLSALKKLLLTQLVEYQYLWMRPNCILLSKLAKLLFENFLSIVQLLLYKIKIVPYWGVIPYLGSLPISNSDFFFFYKYKHTYVH